ncbi:MAPEG family protein [Aquibium sp. LZ166]|uniref:MAPEG family protein n=1 Tax=Aquibium pacificus TaxID=3153579 RepID=A0ABV3SBN7_9HYPH
MSFELHALLGAVVLGLVHLSAASFSFKAQVGNKYTVGPRDEGLQPTGISARLYRANANFLETFPYFAVCVLVVQTTGSEGTLSQIGSALYLAGRIMFLPLYAAGLPWVRTLSWNAATLGLVLVGVQYVVSESS